eukprot:5534984-Pyramimonas_sp.AAC.1
MVHDPVLLVRLAHLVRRGRRVVHLREDVCDGQALHAVRGPRVRVRLEVVQQLPHVVPDTRKKGGRSVAGRQSQRGRENIRTKGRENGS